MTIYAPPGQPGSPANYASRYDNFIGGEWVPPVKGQYFENPTPVTGQTFTEVARGTAGDIELALDAAHGAAPGWGRTSARIRRAASAAASAVSVTGPAPAPTRCWRESAASWCR